jgi:peroxiredoxin
MKALSGVLAGGVFLAVVLAGGARALAAGASVLPPEGYAFQDFTLPDVTGRQVSLSDFRGKPVLLSFWSCYSDTCFTSVRVFEELLKEYGSRGLAAVTVCSELPPALEKDGYAGLLKQCSAGQVVLIDKDGKLTKKYGVTVFPATVLLGRDLFVRQVISGVRPLMEEGFRLAVRLAVENGE